LGIGDWAQSPIPNPQSPIPNPHFLTKRENNSIKVIIYNKLYHNYKKITYDN